MSTTENVVCTEWHVFVSHVSIDEYGLGRIEHLEPSIKQRGISACTIGIGVGTVPILFQLECGSLSLLQEIMPSLEREKKQNA